MINLFIAAIISTLKFRVITQWQKPSSCDVGIPTIWNFCISMTFASVKWIKEKTSVNLQEVEGSFQIRQVRDVRPKDYLLYHYTRDIDLSVSS